MNEGHSERLNAALGGRYRITRELGEGGMATVYLADDLRHQRPVALKVLRPELAAVVGAERFLAEITTTANLQHPHILPLFDSGEADKLLFYVMPYVEGESLRDKLDREHQLPVEEAMRIATNVAEALDYAHRHGVVHRDIKPANVLLLDGKPVISDFGIALAVTARGTGRLTETGLSLGTPHYMSPEQATGDQGVGPAADIWALGCVLYEMLVGEPPYTGSTPQAVLGKIVLAEPASATKARKSIPANVDATIRKALEKVPADRFTSASEFVRALADPGFRHGELAPAAGAGAVAQGRWNRLSMALAGAVAVTSALAAWGWLRPAADSTPADVMRFTIVPPEDATLDFLGPYPDLAISPDGRQIVYKGTHPDGAWPMLYVRALDELVGVPLRGAEGGLGPVVSPDGAWVAFVTFDRPSTVQRVSILGGVPVTLAESPNPISGMSWGTDDRIIFGSSNGGLFRVSAGGGEPEALTTLDRDQGDFTHRWPSIIEGREAVVFMIAPSGNTLNVGQLAVLDLSSGEVTRLGIQGVSPRYVPTGHLVYAAEDGSVRAVPFDARSLTVTGSTVPLIEGVVVKASGAADFDVSRDGRMVYALGASTVERSLVWVGRDGREESIAAPPRTYFYPRLSPDARRVALDVRDDGESGIWIWDLAGETLTRLALGNGAYTYPTWTPDGGRIAYAAAPDTISWKASNNTGAPEVLAASPGAGGLGGPNPYFFTPDGTALVFRDQANPETNDDLAMIRVGGDAAPLWRLNGAFIERNAELSPNGRWMAYQSDESGAFEIYVRPFPDVEADQVQVSNNRGASPLWSRDGSELFYLQPGAPNQLISVSVDTGGTDRAFAFRGREVVAEWPYYTVGEGRNYDVSPDGRRFLAVKLPDAAGGGAAPEIAVVLNWFEEIRQRMGN